MHRVWKVLICLATLALGQPSFAEESQPGDPQTLVQSVTTDVLQVLRENKDRIAKDPGFLDTKVEELILPYLDFVAMSKLVLGKNWRTATDEQRDAFVEQFRALLVRTYKTSLTEYSSETIDFLPFRESAQPEKLAVVRTEIKRAGGPPLPIIYSLRYKKEDGWKVYDIGIEGVSLVTNYRSSFSREIAQKGIDSLIESLKERNEKGQTDEVVSGD